VPEQAAAQKGWDPITWGVGRRQDLEQWAEWLDVNGVKHSMSLSISANSHTFSGCCPGVVWDVFCHSRKSLLTDCDNFRSYSDWD
jgi:hypothetical protein